MNHKNSHQLEEIKWGGFLNEFLWICAGVNRKILRQCPTDYAKYAGIGGTILFTALMAMLSGGYAMYFVFKNVLTSMLFGVFWGLLIFNLDRFIVNTMYSDGKASISWFELFSGLPRIIMAIFLGIVISTPLELKIFEDEINIAIKDLKQDKLKEHTAYDQRMLDSLSQVRYELAHNTPMSIYDPQIISGNQTVNALLLNLKNKEAEMNREIQNIKQIDEQLKSLLPTDSIQIKQLNNKKYKHITTRNNINSEITNINGKIATCSEDLKQQGEAKARERELELKVLDERIAGLRQRIEDNDTTYKKSLDEEFGGFQARMHAFSIMKDENLSTWWSSLFIMLLFIIIETAPTFFKMMIAAGPYDDLLRSEMHKARVLSDKRISDLNDEINTEVKISTERNRNRLEAEVLANKMLLEKIAAAQSEMLSVAIEKWRVEELKKIEENPSAYIHTTTESSQLNNNV